MDQDEVRLLAQYRYAKKWDVGMSPLAAHAVKLHHFCEQPEGANGLWHSTPVCCDAAVGIAADWAKVTWRAGTRIHFFRRGGGSAQ
jgi:hypothetical protein